MGIPDRLGSWYLLPRPVATVCLDLRLAEAGAGRDDLSLRWRQLRRQLEDAGVDAGTAALLDHQISQLPAAPRAVALLSDGVQVQEFPVSGIGDLAVPGPLPYGLPALLWQQRRVPYVLALVDRLGGDLVAYADDGTELAHRTITGPDDEIERNAPGGWAQGRYQNRAEDSWRHNAGAVAEALPPLVGRSGARLIALGGDVRAVQLLLERVPPALRPMVHPIEHGGGRGESGGGPARTAAVDLVVHEAARSEAAAAVARLRAGLGSNDAAVLGVEEVAAAMRRGAVDVLYVHHDPQDWRTAWYGDQPGAIALGADDPAAPTPAHLTDVFVRAALSTDAGVLVLEEPIPEAPDGVAARCRF